MLEYFNGIYVYFMMMDFSDNLVYLYVIGLEFYGIL